MLAEKKFYISPIFRLSTDYYSGFVKTKPEMRKMPNPNVKKMKLPSFDVINLFLSCDYCNIINMKISINLRFYLYRVFY